MLYLFRIARYRASRRVCVFLGGRKEEDYKVGDAVSCKKATWGVWMGGVRVPLRDRLRHEHSNCSDRKTARLLVPWWTFIPSSHPRKSADRPILVGWKLIDNKFRYRYG